MRRLVLSMREFRQRVCSFRVTVPFFLFVTLVAVGGAASLGDGDLAPSLRIGWLENENVRWLDDEKPMFTIGSVVFATNHSQEQRSGLLRSHLQICPADGLSSERIPSHTFVMEVLLARGLAGRGGGGGGGEGSSGEGGGGGERGVALTRASCGRSLSSTMCWALHTSSLGSNDKSSKGLQRGQLWMAMVSGEAADEKSQMQMRPLDDTRVSVSVSVSASSPNALRITVRQASAFNVAVVTGHPAQHSAAQMHHVRPAPASAPVLAAVEKLVLPFSELRWAMDWPYFMRFTVNDALPGSLAYATLYLEDPADSGLSLYTVNTNFTNFVYLSTPATNSAKAAVPVQVPYGTLVEKDYKMRVTIYFADTETPPVSRLSGPIKLLQGLFKLAAGQMIRANESSYIRVTWTFEGAPTSLRLELLATSDTANPRFATDVMSNASPYVFPVPPVLTARYVARLYIPSNRRVLVNSLAFQVVYNGTIPSPTPTPVHSPSPTVDPATLAATGSSGGISTTMLIGIAVGGGVVLLVASIVLVAGLIYRNRRSKEAQAVLAATSSSEASAWGDPPVKRRRSTISRPVGQPLPTSAELGLEADAANLHEWEGRDLRRPDTIEEQDDRARNGARLDDDDEDDHQRVEGSGSGPYPRLAEMPYVLPSARRRQPLSAMGAGNTLDDSPHLLHDPMPIDSLNGELYILDESAVVVVDDDDEDDDQGSHSSNEEGLAAIGEEEHSMPHISLPPDHNENNLVRVSSSEPLLLSSVSVSPDPQPLPDQQDRTYWRVPSASKRAVPFASPAWGEATAVNVAQIQDRNMSNMRLVPPSTAPASSSLAARYPPLVPPATAPAHSHHTPYQSPRRSSLPPLHHYPAPVSSLPPPPATSAPPTQHNDDDEFPSVGTPLTKPPTPNRALAQGGDTQHHDTADESTALMGPKGSSDGSGYGFGGVGTLMGPSPAPAFAPAFGQAPPPLAHIPSHEFETSFDDDFMRSQSDDGIRLESVRSRSFPDSAMGHRRSSSVAPGPTSDSPVPAPYSSFASRRRPDSSSEAHSVARRSSTRSAKDVAQPIHEDEEVPILSAPPHLPRRAGPFPLRAPTYKN